MHWTTFQKKNALDYILKEECVRLHLKSRMCWTVFQKKNALDYISEEE